MPVHGFFGVSEEHAEKRRSGDRVIIQDLSFQRRPPGKYNDKKDHKGYISHSMRVRISFCSGQVSALLVLVLVACSSGKDQDMVEPPATNPLSLSFIGYGVINTSYTLVLDRPETEGASLGYLRWGATVKVIERRFTGGPESLEPWLLIEGGVKGWIREQSADIYENEYKASTASELMNR
jgi:hypothetical protein